jgi:chromosome segregation ATPase
MNAVDEALEEAREYHQSRVASHESALREYNSATQDVERDLAESKAKLREVEDEITLRRSRR